MFKKKAKENISNVDKIVTGVIIGSAVASIFGLSKTKKGQVVVEKTSSGVRGGFKKSFGLLGKMLVGILKIFTKKKK